MKSSRASAVWIFLCFVFCLVLHIARPDFALAQCNTSNSRGWNTVYGKCTSSPGEQAAFAIVDAAQYSAGGSSPDICGPIHTILSQSNKSNGIVIDARGFGSTTLSCTMNSNPWDGTSQKSNVVLLPAGTITIGQAWILPAQTRLIGAGAGLTTIQAQASFSGDMIDMGNSTICGATCPGIAIEHLTLNGNGNGVNGIVNNYAQELSYVNDVVMTGMTANHIGLSLGVRSNNSGPYMNIKYSGSGTCVQIFDGTHNVFRTRGIRGLTCIMSGSSPAAVYLDTPNNRLEDVYIQGASSAQDGILVGSQDLAYNNQIVNVHGHGLHDVVHLHKDASKPYSVADTVILASTCSGTGGCPGNNIEDELAGGATLTDASVGMYLVGEPVLGGTPTSRTTIGYSRFSTSPSSTSATWLVGSTGPGTFGCNTGSVYTCTNTASCTSTTLWDCEVGSWVPIK